MPKFLESISWRNSSGTLKNIDEVPAIKGVLAPYQVLVSNNNNPTWVDIGLRQETVTHNFPTLNATVRSIPSFSSYYETEADSNITTFNITNKYLWYYPPNTTIEPIGFSPSITNTGNQTLTLTPTNSGKWTLNDALITRLKEFITSSDMPNVSTSALNSVSPQIEDNILISALPRILITPSQSVTLTFPAYVSISCQFQWVYRTATINSQLAKNDLNTLKNQVQEKLRNFNAFEFIFNNYSYSETHIRPSELTSN